MLDKDTLHRLYVVEAKTRYDIAKETGIPVSRVVSLLQKYKVTKYNVKKHHLMTHPLYTTWCGMKERCKNPNNVNYKWYGGKGITFDPSWNDFKPFYDWALANGWREGLTLDRVNGDEAYTPANCRWISHKNQCRNRVTNVSITVCGKTMLQCEWEEYLHIPRKYIAKWKMRHGMDYVTARLEGMMQNVQNQCKANY